MARVHPRTRERNMKIVRMDGPVPDLERRGGLYPKESRLEAGRGQEMTPRQGVS